jgi:hypothetical protein
MANLHNSQITTTNAKPFLACYVFTSRSLAKASNSGDSSASRTQVLSSEPPVQNSTPNCLGSPRYLPYNPLAWSEYKTPFPRVILLLRAYSLSRERVYQSVAEKRPLFIRLSRSHCITTAVHATKRKLEKIPAVWDMTPCSLVDTYQRFGVTCCLHF